MSKSGKSEYHMDGFRLEREASDPRDHDDDEICICIPLHVTKTKTW